MATVDIEVDYYLDEASGGALIAEVKRRIAKGEITSGDLGPVQGDETWCKRGMADDIRTAFYARNAARLEHLLTVLERYEAPDA
jgi:hypothetical protein